MTTHSEAPARAAAPLTFLWLEITGKCPLACRHCYADSGPAGTHGTMTTADWQNVIAQAATLGVQLIQYIGGEPTLHPDLPHLIRRTLGAGIEAEVFSNLAHVTPALWETFSLPGVRLATSWYSDDPGQHRQVTGRSTHARTRASIIEAVRRGIPIRAGIIDVLGGQRTTQAHAELHALGVTDIGSDRVRGIGRGGDTRDPGQLCGGCGDGIAAISPDGQVWPCVMARWMTAGSVRDQDLSAILSGRTWHDQVAAIPPPQARCGPDTCSPQCNPLCYPNCPPRSHCNPNR
ncbi:MAG TPA: radical SAM/SPASM domain-containing protein [Streptosporangiaceae bacterium]|jgi:MoaA/NifB/PqqE/SkfB family radical SAM enzyme